MSSIPRRAPRASETRQRERCPGPDLPLDAIRTAPIACLRRCKPAAQSTQGYPQPSRVVDSTSTLTSTSPKYVDCKVQTAAGSHIQHDDRSFHYPVMVKSAFPSLGFLHNLISSPQRSSNNKPVAHPYTTHSWSPACQWSYTPSFRVLAELSALGCERRRTYTRSGAEESNRTCIQRSSWRRRGAIPHKAINNLSPDRAQSLTFLPHSIEATSQTNEYDLSLTFKSGGIEQGLGGNETATILIDPTLLKFHILYVAFRPFSTDLPPHLIPFSIFPKPSLPEGSLHCVRVWMEAGPNNVQHRIFSDNNLWIARDPPFHTVSHMALAQLAPTTPIISDAYWSRTYRSFVGRAPCDFIASLTLLTSFDRVYSVTLDYEAGAVKRRIFDNIKVRLSCRLEDIHFVI